MTKPSVLSYHDRMKPLSSYVLLPTLAIMLLSHSSAFSCTVCHSKNPKMVRMHEALEYKDCFTCHQPGLKKTGKALKKQMTGNERCVRCHKK